VSAWHGHYCLHLDAAGFPCNRPTMRLGMCDQHREAKPRARNAEVERRAQERFRERQQKSKASAGLAPAMEVA
jgi:hypothetical protein